MLYLDATRIFDENEEPLDEAALRSTLISEGITYVEDDTFTNFKNFLVYMFTDFAQKLMTSADGHFTFEKLFDESGEVAMRDVKTTVSATYRDQEGNYVVQTGVGPITLLV